MENINLKRQIGVRTATVAEDVDGSVCFHASWQRFSCVRKHDILLLPTPYKPLHKVYISLANFRSIFVKLLSTNFLLQTWTPYVFSNKITFGLYQVFLWVVRLQLRVVRVNSEPVTSRCRRRGDQTDWHTKCRLCWYCTVFTVLDTCRHYFCNSSWRAFEARQNSCITPGIFYSFLY